MWRRQWRVLTTCLLLALVAAPAKAERLVLGEVLQQTLLRNPELQLFPYEQRAAEANAIQAGLRPNPSLSLSVENVLGSGEAQGFESAETTLQLSQLVELGEKRQRRVDLATVQQRQKVIDYEFQRVEVLTEATRRYYELVYRQTLLEWSRQRIVIEQKALDQIRARANAGAAQQADVSGLALRLAESQAEQHLLEGQLRLAQRRLAVMWQSEPEAMWAEGDLAQLERIPSAAQVLNAMDRAPSYLQLLERVRLMEAQRRLEEANGQWDVTLGMGLKRSEETNDTSLLFELKVPLQLNSPNQGNLLAARAEEEQALHHQRLARQTLRLTLLGVHHSLSNQMDRIEHLGQSLLPLAHQWLEQVETGYETGQQSVLSLLAAQSKQFELERQRIDARYSAWLQLLELERLTGQSFETVTQTDPSPENQS
ncbi:TolC family protein [Ferrimonas balearica]|uniref:TolC family protein n=1 Tax=Ferrimonas balearica TaxID=44012 RepID=UPI001C99B116|nr:TolC family protein [Ferrimonas balearica]MBY5920665.1 TolC family protein [Ferrimonas balearica]MBY5996650.1 TolC family protein [Ferrimonas balearica]